MHPALGFAVLFMLLGLSMYLLVLLAYFSFCFLWSGSYLLKFLGFFSFIIACVSAIGNDFGRCENVVKKWASASLEQQVTEDKHTLQDLLFFLHVPRTGGRTYFHW